MNWTELLKAELQSTYATTDKLVAMVDDTALGWKPATGANWMTCAQLLRHMGEGSGAAFRGFITGDWGLPADANPALLTSLPTVDQLPAVESVAEACRLLEQDRQLAFATLAKCAEERLASEPAPAPWDPTPFLLGHRLLQMIEHLKSHKSQLFYYLKLQGKPVSTSDLWGR
ncbi:MAG: DinB family protein [Candidatus Solibacter sp.]|nr:DinB family protein [Candidatus Solibacter sp.]